MKERVGQSLGFWIQVKLLGMKEEPEGHGSKDHGEFPECWGVPPRTYTQIFLATQSGLQMNLPGLRVMVC